VLLVAAGLGSPGEHALISLLALNGLRVSEATGANIENLGVERGHRTLVIIRKGGKVVTIPLTPRTARAIDLAVGERVDGPIFFTSDGQRLDRHGAARIVRRVARRAGISKPVGPHTLRHAFITAASFDAGVPPRDVQEAASHADPRTTMRYETLGNCIRWASRIRLSESWPPELSFRSCGGEGFRRGSLIRRARLVQDSPVTCFWGVGVAADRLGGCGGRAADGRGRPSAAGGGDGRGDAGGPAGAAGRPGAAREDDRRA
jgi:Phage integrase family